jgi:surface polysaccharide O-acyltransferase-like enzyme
VDSFVQEFISMGLAQFAVPMFFAISGFLFFRNFSASLECYRTKCEKRFFTLVIPYLFWCTAGYLFVLALQSIPISRVYFSKQLFSAVSPGQLITVLFVNPVPGQFWFVAELIKYAILAPLIYYLVKHVSYYLLLPFFGIWLCNVNMVALNAEGFLYFLVGAVIAIKRLDLEWAPRYGVVLLVMVAWAVLLLFSTYWSLEKVPAAVYLDKDAILFGLFSVWFAYDLLARNRQLNQRLLRMTTLTFFIFAAHEPLQTVYKKLLLARAGVTPTTNLVVYLAAPLITLVSVIVVGLSLQRYVPAFYGIITGGRGEKQAVLPAERSQHTWPLAGAGRHRVQ